MQVLHSFNWAKYAVRFCHQVAAWVSDMFCNFCLVKNHKIGLYLTTTKAREKYALIWNYRNLEIFCFMFD